jgi:hypothetical protein
MSTSTTNSNDQLIPFLWIRRGIGLMGFLFPVILVLGNKLITGCDMIQRSISAYYHTPMQTFFVAVLSVLAIFLFTYRGPNGEDSHWANLASVLCLGVAFFPTTTQELDPKCLGWESYQMPVPHLISAIGLFLVLGHFSLNLFTKTGATQSEVTDMKIIRNRVYRICGYLMFGAMAAMVILYVYEHFIIKTDIPFPYIFFLEWLALWAFGTSWIVKGDWFLGDRAPRI